MCMYSTTDCTYIYYNLTLPSIVLADPLFNKKSKFFIKFLLVFFRLFLLHVYIHTDNKGIEEEDRSLGNHQLLPPVFIHIFTKKNTISFLLENQSANSGLPHSLVKKCPLSYHPHMPPAIYPAFKQHIPHTYLVGIV